MTVDSEFGDFDDLIADQHRVAWACSVHYIPLPTINNMVTRMPTSEPEVADLALEIV